MDGGACCSPWGREESDTTERLHFHFYALEKEMATHSSVLAWRMPGTGSLVGCRLWGRTERGTADMTQQQQQLHRKPRVVVTPGVHRVARSRHGAEHGVDSRSRH